MDCQTCRNLKQAYDDGLSRYIEARSSVIYRFSTRFAAYKRVEMERAKADLEEHWFVCASSNWAIAFLPQQELSVELSQLAA